MAVRKGSGSRAFFLELVLDLVVFALCATVCLQVFASAKTASDRSAALSHLGVEAQVLAEDFKATEGDALALATRFPGGELSDSTLYLYFDKDFNQTSAAYAVYVLSCEVESSSTVRQAFISATQGEHELFSLTAAQYGSSEASGDGGVS